MRHVLDLYVEDTSYWQQIVFWLSF